MCRFLPRIYESHTFNILPVRANSAPQAGRNDDTETYESLETPLNIFTFDNDKTWIHRDNTEYAGVLYLTPNAPCSGGTSLYRHIETNTRIMNPNSENPEDKKILELLDRDSNDLTKWERTDYAANYFNRLILFKGWNNHRSHFHFGRKKEPETGRLFQVFFFDGKPKN